MEDKKLNEQESMALIAQMINVAKDDFKSDGFEFLLWGWVVFLVALTEFILLKIGIEQHAAVWIILMPVGIFSGIYSSKRNKTIAAKSYFSETFGYVWIALGAAFIVCMFLMPKAGAEVVYPFIIVLYGIGTFVSGKILKFKPLMLGGIICFVIALLSIYVPFSIQLLLLAASLLISYIIPGHMLSANSKKQ